MVSSLPPLLDHRIADNLTVHGTDEGLINGRAYVLLYQAKQTTFVYDREVHTVACLVQQVGNKVISSVIKNSGNWDKEPQIRLSQFQYDILKAFLDPSKTDLFLQLFKAKPRVRLTQTELEEFLGDKSDKFKLFLKEEDGCFCEDVEKLYSAFPQGTSAATREKIYKHKTTQQETVCLTPKDVHDIGGGFGIHWLQEGIDGNTMQEMLLSYFPPPSKEIFVKDARVHEDVPFSPGNYLEFIAKHLAWDESPLLPGKCTQIKEVQIQIASTEEKKE